MGETPVCGRERYVDKIGFTPDSQYVLIVRVDNQYGIFVGIASVPMREVSGVRLSGSPPSCINIELITKNEGNLTLDRWNKLRWSGLELPQLILAHYIITWNRNGKPTIRLRRA